MVPKKTRPIVCSGSWIFFEHFQHLLASGDRPSAVHALHETKPVLDIVQHNVHLPRGKASFGRMEFEGIVLDAIQNEPRRRWRVDREEI